MPPHSNFATPPLPPITMSLSTGIPKGAISCVPNQSCSSIAREEASTVPSKRAYTRNIEAAAAAAAAAATLPTTTATTYHTKRITNNNETPAPSPTSSPPPPTPVTQPPNLTKNDQEYLGKVCVRLQQKYGSRTSRLVHAAKLHDKGIQYIEEGNAHKALNLLRQSLQIRSCIHGVYHEDIAASLYNLGRVYHDREDYTTALDLYTRVLDIQNRVLKKGHVGIITTITNIARVHHLRGDLDQALIMNKTLLTVTIDKVGKNHPFVASVYRTVGTILLERKQLDNAMRAFVMASRITKATDEDDLDASTAMIMSRSRRRPPDAAAA